MVLDRDQELDERTDLPEGEIKAFLGTGTEFQGTLTFEGTIRVDGKVSGDVISRDTLIVGEEAEVEAEISVGTLVSRGSIKGNVKASGRVELHETSELRGNISTPRIRIDEGAVFHGSCEMPQAADKVTPIDQTKATTFGWREAKEEEEEEEEAQSIP